VLTVCSHTLSNAQRVTLSSLAVELYGGIMGLHQRQTHPEYVEGCFGCKIQLLELSTGDARGDVIASGTTQKKWNSELEAYRSARAQGIQPNGTNRKQVEAAHKASEKLGVAYDGNTMVQAKKIDKPTATVMRELKEAGI